jgi:hypothetical protein
VIKYNSFFYIKFIYFEFVLHQYCLVILIDLDSTVGRIPGYKYRRPQDHKLFLTFFTATNLLYDFVNENDHELL